MISRSLSFSRRSETFWGVSQVKVNDLAVVPMAPAPKIRVGVPLVDMVGRNFSDTEEMCGSR